MRASPPNAGLVISPSRLPSRSGAAGGNAHVEGAMHERYEALRSVGDKSLHLIFIQGGFADLPTRIRAAGQQE